eukprot:4114573-Lingulodinium_polyedra.AAC.1
MGTNMQWYLHDPRSGVTWVLRPRRAYHWAEGTQVGPPLHTGNTPGSTTSGTDADSGEYAVAVEQAMAQAVGDRPAQAEQQQEADAGSE